MGRLKVTSFDPDIVDHPIKSKYYTIKHRLKPLQRMRKYMLIFNELELLTNSEGMLIINKESKMFDAYVMFALQQSNFKKIDKLREEKSLSMKV